MAWQACGRRTGKTPQPRPNPQEILCFHVHAHGEESLRAADGGWNGGMVEERGAGDWFRSAMIPAFRYSIIPLVPASWLLPCADLEAEGGGGVEEGGGGMVEMDADGGEFAAAGVVSAEAVEAAAEFGGIGRFRREIGRAHV